MQLLWLVLLLWLGGCAQILPQAENRQGRGWQDFRSARDAFATILPFASSRAQVHAMGLDPFDNPSITLLSYADLVQRLGTGNVLHADQLDPGVRLCMVSAKRCTGYQLAQREVHFKRVGNPWADLFNFRRQTESEGWSFNALIVFVDDQVVLALYGGQPRIHETTLQVNPLGPFQSLPERAGQAVIRP